MTLTRLLKKSSTTSSKLEKISAISAKGLGIRNFSISPIGDDPSPPFPVITSSAADDGFSPSLSFPPACRDGMGYVVKAPVVGTNAADGIADTAATRAQSNVEDDERIS